MRDTLGHWRASENRDVKYWIEEKIKYRISTRKKGPVLLLDSKYNKNEWKNPSKDGSISTIFHVRSYGKSIFRKTRTVEL